MLVVYKTDSLTHSL